MGSVSTLGGRVGAALGRVLASPLLVGLHLQAALIGRERAFHVTSQLASLVPDGLGTLMRRGFYAGALDRSGSSTSVGFGTVFSKPGTVLGEAVYLGKRCCVGLVTVGDDVLVGDHVHLLSGRHQHGFADTDRPIREQAGTYERITIGAGTWIGTGAIVMADVGAHAVVAAGSVVTTPVPAYGVVAGNPARLVRTRR